MIRKAFLALAVVVAPIGATTAIGVVGGVGGGVAGAATATTYTCAQTGTVTFQKPGLSNGGALTANTAVKTAAAITGSGSGCSTTPIKVSIASATTPCPQTGGVPNSGDPSACLAQKNGVYAIGSKPNYYDTSASYATSGLSDLQAALAAKPLKTTVDGIKVSLAYGSASEVAPGGACGASDSGFALSGNANISSGALTTYTDTICIVGDTGTNTTGDFVTDLLTSAGGDSSVLITGLTLGGPDSQLVIGLPTADCSLGGTVTFAKPGLSNGGSLTSATTEKSAAAVTPTGTNCAGVAIKASIPSSTTACPQTGGTPNPGDPGACFTQSKGVYEIGSKPNYYDTAGSYATSGTSDLAAALEAKPLKTTDNGLKVTLLYGTASQVAPGGSCGASAAGFALAGNAEVGTAIVGTYTANVCITGDSGTDTTGNFVTDLLVAAGGSDPALTIATGTVGSPSNLTITLNG